MNLKTTPELKSSYGRITRMLFESHLPEILNAAIEIGLFEALAGYRRRPALFPWVSGLGN